MTVTGAEAHHAVTVNRTRVGDSLTIGNGRGLLLWGLVRDVMPEHLNLQVREVSMVDLPEPRIVLVQALAKGNRDELAVQAATELGADRIVPWAAERSIARWDGVAAGKGRQRWQRVVREATKQSIRSWLPEVASLATLPTLTALAVRNDSHRMLVLDPSATQTLAAAVDTASRSAASTGPREFVVVVGPEGGISARERDELESAGAVAVRLGPSVLRTSTAGPAAIAALSVLLGRW